MKTKLAKLQGSNSVLTMAPVGSWNVRKT